MSTLSFDRRATLDVRPAPEWWPAAFWRRQEALRAAVLRTLRAAAEAGHPEMCTATIYQHATRFERGEHEHCLTALHREGLVLCEPRREPKTCAGSMLVTRFYWRLAGPAS